MSKSALTTSVKGIAFLERHEGVVTKAYRDPVGVWTIGAGLTKASGVVTPRAQMVISPADASRLLAEALTRNYEPTVNAVMGKCIQREFDAGVDFHFNTGAIARASWVKAWKAGDWTTTEVKIKLWNRAGGRVLSGLVRRRKEEFELMRMGTYGASQASATPSGSAKFAIHLDVGDIAALRAGLSKLGYDVGTDARGVALLAVVNFQRDHDLKVDGIVGKATLAALQRRLDAPRKVTAPAGATAAGGAATSADAAQALGDLPSWAGPALLGLGLFMLIYVGWQYRDVVAVKVQRPLPRLARLLRSV